MFDSCSEDLIYLHSNTLKALKMVGARLFEINAPNLESLSMYIASLVSEFNDVSFSSQTTHTHHTHINRHTQSSHIVSQVLAGAFCDRAMLQKTIASLASCTHPTFSSTKAA